MLTKTIEQLLRERGPLSSQQIKEELAYTSHSRRVLTQTIHHLKKIGRIVSKKPGLYQCGYPVSRRLSTNNNARRARARYWANPKEFCEQALARYYARLGRGKEKRK